MTRRKDAPLSAEEEREQLRQLTRELHEAAQEARDAARELHAQRAMTARSAADQATAVINPLIAALNKQVKETEDVIVANLEAGREKIEDHHRELLGFADRTEMAAWIAGQITRHLERPDYLDAVANRLLQNAAQIWSKQRDEIQLGAAERLAEFIRDGQFSGEFQLRGLS